MCQLLNSIRQALFNQQFLHKGSSFSYQVTRKLRSLSKSFQSVFMRQWQELVPKNNNVREFHLTNGYINQRQTLQCKSGNNNLFHHHEACFRRVQQRVIRNLKISRDGTRLWLNTTRNYSTGNYQLSVLSNNEYREYLASLEAEYEVISTAGSDPNKRLLFLTPVVHKFRDIKEKESELQELNCLLEGSEDKEFVAMVTKERSGLQDELEEMDNELILLLAGEVKVDQNDIIVELSSGVGGQEAMLFTGDMLEMYQGYAHYKGWTFHMLGCELSETGGVRRASASIAGTDVFRHLKFEGGVHRVQRVPKTEKSGRIHTSTMTVAILPQVQDIDISINLKDLVVETFKASGKGGQHVNTTDSAVRITHLPTKTVAECQVERSQIRNRELALKILRSRMYDAQMRSQTEQMQTARNLQTGSGGRSEKIRTYNFPQDRITDHRLGKSFHNMETFLDGGEELDELINEMMWKVKCDIVTDIVDEFVRKRK